MKIIVGIDFGTSTTVVRYKIEGKGGVNTIKDRVFDVIPTIILRTTTGETLYGTDALNRSGSNGLEPIVNFKMGLISKSEKIRKESENNIIEFLSYIHRLFIEQTRGVHYTDMDVYVSYPAKWDHASIKFMEKAVREAGFEGNIYGVDEPHAATYNMLHKHFNIFKANQLFENNKPINVFMLDMGAGTADIEIFKLSYTKQNGIRIFDPLSYPLAGNNKFCGGHEIDKLISDYINNSAIEAGLPKRMYLKPNGVKLWKDTDMSLCLKHNEISSIPPALNSWLENAVDFGQLTETKPFEELWSMSREKFETITSSHWKNLYGLIKGAITEYKKMYGIGAEDIDALFLTGGHSQWYTVHKLFNGEGLVPEAGLKTTLNFKKLIERPDRMFVDALPHECVAIGLCLQNEQIKIDNRPTLKETGSPKQPKESSNNDKYDMIPVCVESSITNNLWIQLSIDEKETDLYQIFKAGTSTRDADGNPTTSTKEWKLSLKRNLLFGNHSFNLTITMYSGTTIKTSHVRKLNYKMSDNLLADLKNRFWGLLTYGFGDGTWDFAFDISFEAMDNGEFTLLGSCTMDNGSQTFSFDEEAFDII